MYFELWRAEIRGQQKAIQSIPSLIKRIILLQINYFLQCRNMIGSKVYVEFHSRIEWNRCQTRGGDVGLFNILNERIPESDVVRSYFEFFRTHWTKTDHGLFPRIFWRRSGFDEVYILNKILNGTHLAMDIFLFMAVLLS